MSDYIDRERLKEAFHADLQTLQFLDESTINLILTDIDEAPVADVVSVVHGHWINKTNINRAIVEQRVDCSVCGYIFYTTTALSFEYCPNCGAKMDDDSKEVKE